VILLTVPARRNTFREHDLGSGQNLKRRLRSTPGGSVLHTTLTGARSIGF
jgi:hypothetical protein